MRARSTLVGVTAAVLLVSSCSSSPGTVPAAETNTSTPGQASSTTSSSVPPGVPTVTDPIAMTRYIEQPCSALTETQLAQLSIPTEPEPQPDDPAGPSCAWDAYDETGIVLTGGPITAGSSLAGSYKKNNRGGFEHFKTVTVAGYPGTLNWDDDISCTAAVAVRNDLLYAMVARVDQDSSYQGQQCEIAKHAAELATKTMSGGS